VKAVLHIGAEKTGTSSIQRSLISNAPMLEENGYYFSRAGGVENNFKLFVCGLGARAPRDSLASRIGVKSLGDVARLESEICSIIREEVKCHAGRTFIFSSEHLQARLTNYEEIVAVRKLLSRFFNEIEVLIYFRDPIKYAKSLFSTSLKFGGVRRFFPPVVDDSGDVNYRYNYMKIMKGWMRAFPQSKFSVRLYDSQELINGNVIDDFYCFLGLQNAPRKKLNEVVNVGLSVQGQKILLFLNWLQKNDHNIAKSIERKRKHVVRYLECHYPGEGLNPTAPIVNEYEDLLFESDEWLRKTFFSDREGRLFNYDVPVNSSAELFDPDLGSVARCLVHVFDDQNINSK